LCTQTKNKKENTRKLELVESFLTASVQTFSSQKKKELKTTLGNDEWIFEAKNEDEYNHWLNLLTAYSL